MACYISPDDPTQSLGWDALFPDVLPFVRGAPDEIVAHNIRRSTIEFCRRSGILHDTKKYNLQANVWHYPLETECGYEIIRIFRVTVDDRYDYFPLNRKIPFTCGHFMFYMESPTCLHIRRPPQKDDPNGLEVEVLVQPKQDSCVLDKYLYQMWSDGICAGAVSRLLSIPNTNWRDPKEAERQDLKFRKEVARARAEIDRSFTMDQRMKTELWTGPGGRGWGGCNPNTFC